MLRIKHVEYVNNYILKILFSDGKTKIINFESWINEGGFYVAPMKDIEYFKKVKMDEFNYSICWPNGADFSPHALYEVGSENVPNEETIRVFKETDERKNLVQHKNPDDLIDKLSLK